MATAQQQQLERAVGRIGAAAFRQNLIEELLPLAERFNAGLLQPLSTFADTYGVYADRVRKGVEGYIFTPINGRADAALPAAIPPALSPSRDWLEQDWTLRKDFFPAYFRLLSVQTFPIWELYDAVSGGMALALAYALASLPPPIPLFELTLPDALRREEVEKRWGPLAALLPAEPIPYTGRTTLHPSRKPRIPTKEQLTSRKVVKNHADFISWVPSVPPLVAPRLPSGEKIYFDLHSLGSNIRNGAVAHAPAQLRFYVANALLQKFSMMKDAKGQPPKLVLTACSRFGVGKKEPSVTHESGRVFDVYRVAPDPQSYSPQQLLQVPKWASASKDKAPSVAAKESSRLGSSAAQNVVTHRATFPDAREAPPVEDPGFAYGALKDSVIGPAMAAYFEGLPHRLNGSTPEAAWRKTSAILAGTPDFPDPELRRWLHELLVAILLTMPEFVIFAGQKILWGAVAALEDAGLAQWPIFQRWLLGLGAAFQAGKGLSFAVPDLHSTHVHFEYADASQVTREEIEFWCAAGVDFAPFRAAVAQILKSSDIDAFKPEALAELESTALATSVFKAGTDLEGPIAQAMGAHKAGEVDVVDREDSSFDPSPELRGVLVSARGYSVSPIPDWSSIEEAVDFAAPGPLLLANTVFAAWWSELGASVLSSNGPADNDLIDGAETLVQALMNSDLAAKFGRFCVAAAVGQHVKGVSRLAFDDLARGFPSANELPVVWTVAPVKGKIQLVGWRWRTPPPSTAPGARAKKGNATKKPAELPYYRHAIPVDLRLLDGEPDLGVRYRIAEGAVVVVDVEPDWTPIVRRALGRRRNQRLVVRATEVGAQLSKMVGPIRDDLSATRNMWAAQGPLFALVVADYLITLRKPRLLTYVATIGVGPVQVPLTPQKK
ncbi:MAG: hypothetical protein U1E65_21915 [Myxococcota bacterium]